MKSRTSIDCVRVRVSPDPRDAEALERKRQQITYRPKNGFLLDEVQPREQAPTPVLLRRQAQ